jgi:hypothetical protein
MKKLTSISAISCAMLLAGCVDSYDYRDEPAPIDGSDVVVNAYQPPEQVDIKPTYSSPVESLLQESRKLQAEGNLSGAVASMERALRIEPRNAYLWNKLAHLRMEQGQGGRAAEMAAKSTSLAGADAKLKADNWRIIAQVRRGGGDVNGAVRAEHAAAKLNY